MGEWLRSAYVGILGGLGVFMVLMLPIVAFEYRRYGRFTWRRFLGSAGLSIYGVALVAYTLLPLPDRDVLQCPPGGSSIQWVPFRFIADIQRETAGLGLVAVLTSAATLQVLFNVLLFVPWGIIARRYFSCSILVSTVSGLLASALIEATQFTGLWGFFGCAYRIADIDDLMANTAGALVGALIGPFVLAFMPRQRELIASRHQSRPVTVWRRWLGMIIDCAAFWTAAVVLVLLYRLGLRATGHELSAADDPFSLLLSSLLPGLLVFYLPALFGAGASLGQRVVWLTPAWGSNRLWRRLLRASVVGGLYSLCMFLSGLLPGSVFGVLAAALLVAAAISVPLTSQRGISCVATGARMVDARQGTGESAT